MKHESVKRLFIILNSNYHFRKTPLSIFFYPIFFHKGYPFVVWLVITSCGTAPLPRSHAPPLQDHQLAPWLQKEESYSSASPVWVVMGLLCLCFRTFHIHFNGDLKPWNGLNVFCRHDRELYLQVSKISWLTFWRRNYFF